MRNLINGFGTPLALHRRVTDSPSVTWTNPKKTKLKGLQRKTSKKGDIKQPGLEPVLGHPLMVVSATLAAQAPESVTKIHTAEIFQNKLLQANQPYF